LAEIQPENRQNVQKMRLFAKSSGSQWVNVNLFWDNMLTLFLLNDDNPFVRAHINFGSIFQFLGSLFYCNISVYRSGHLLWPWC